MNSFEVLEEDIRSSKSFEVDYKDIPRMILTQHTKPLELVCLIWCFQKS